MLIQERSTRTFVAVFTLVAAIFLAVNLYIDAAPIRDWWLAGVLLAISIAFWAWLWQEKVSASQVLAVHDELPRARDWPVIAPGASEDLMEEPVDVQEAETDVVKAEEVQLSEFQETPITATVEVESQAQQPTEEPSIMGPVVDEEVIQQAREEDEIAEDVIADAMAAPAAEVGPATPERIEEAGGPVAEPDDLKRIYGIGPRYSEALVAAGIGTFAALSATDLQTLEKVIADAHMSRPHGLDTWQEQAALAARGDWEGLEAFQSTLTVTGRRTEDEPPQE